MTNFNIFAGMVSSILLSGESKLSSIALSNPDRKKYSSKIKQTKRWLQNMKTDYQTYFLPYVLPLLEKLSQSGLLVFSIDGSVVGRGCICLMFSVIYKEKALPIVWKTYKAKKGHLPEQAHLDLLESLKELIPQACKVVITGDGEFDGCDWQQLILDLGYNYVVRTRKDSNMIEQSWDTFQPKEICLEQGSDLLVEGVEFTKKKQHTNLLIWHDKGHKEPLYLLTNLDYTPDIKQFYKKRFKIEPFFRDQKSKGFNIHKSGLSDPKRLDNLLLATCMAYIICIMAAIKASKSIFYDQIARLDGKFLSLFQLGLRFIHLLVDIRQWRSFSIKRDLKPDF